MPKEYSIEFADRAQISYDRLPSSTRERIDQVLSRIQLIGFRPPYVRKIPGRQNMYLARATNDIRIIFLKEDYMIIVLDIVRHDKLLGLARF